ncbi:hypothetical protein [Streptomyces cucumeris]|uniref:hypothetical protein n=1 Tax=Streptomyces cucumeris TaxID=2962890 RepID=UPI0020C8AFA9|nr:hypothetical protein [Streptomyces sp. NEAU-Y11]MCP9209717.1 hypothetical protein [Streptomyces sp. NEAU-Y11]
MMQESAAPGSPEPGPDNFSFEDYLEGVSTFPVFDHTAYLDQRSGAELARILEELENLIADQAELDKRIEAQTHRSSNSFVNVTLDAMMEEREEAEARLSSLLNRRDALTEKIKQSALTLTFQVRTPEELGNVTRDATRQFHKENPKYKNVSEDDLDYITARSRYTLTAQIAHFCTAVQLPDGRTVPAPDRRGAELLLGKLISSETMRLMESIGTGLSASQEWADKLDAGFPGRSSDVEEVSLDQDGPEGGKVVGTASVDDAHGAAVGMDGREEPQAGNGRDHPGGGELQGMRHSSLDRPFDQ